MKHYVLYTDGACRGNPGPGGRGFIVLENGHQIEKNNGSKPHTTNNEMELSAVLFGIQYICQTNGIHIESKSTLPNSLFSYDNHVNITKNFSLDIYLDSQYVRQGVLEYLEDRKKRGWKTTRKKIIKNLELWQELDMYLGLFPIYRHWVKGHNGDRYNEMADILATSAIDNKSLLL